MRKQFFLPVSRKRVTDNIQCKAYESIDFKSDRNFKIPSRNQRCISSRSLGVGKVVLVPMRPDDSPGRVRKISTLPKISAFEVSLAKTKIMQPRHNMKEISQSMLPNDFLLINLFITITGKTLAPPSAIVTVTNDSNFLYDEFLWFLTVKNEIES